MQPGNAVVQQSLVSWAINALGTPALFLLVTAGTVSFCLSLLLTIRGRGAMSAVALVLAAHLPLLTGIFLALLGTISSWMVVATSPTAPKPSEWAEGVSVSLLAPLMGLVLMTPSYTVALVGGLIRALTEDRPPLPPKPIPPDTGRS